MLHALRVSTSATSAFSETETAKQGSGFPSAQPLILCLSGQGFPVVPQEMVTHMGQHRLLSPLGQLGGHLPHVPCKYYQFLSVL